MVTAHQLVATSARRFHRISKVALRERANVLINDRSRLCERDSFSATDSHPATYQLRFPTPPIINLQSPI
jgi:hypothetical protein